MENGKAQVWSQPLILPPRHERLGVREHTRLPRRSRVPRVGSTSSALFEHRWFIGGMKLACFPLELAKPLLRKPYTREAYAPLLSRGISCECAGHTLVRRQNLISINVV